MTRRLLLPSQKYLRECFVYEPKTGKLFWKKRPLEHFSGNVRIWNSTNTRFAGKQAFTFIDPCGHCFGTVSGITCFAHRVIWKLVTGEEPSGDVDHKNRKGHDNRWTNLRLATNAQNQINRSKCWGKSGVTGIRRSENKKSWEARIHKSGRYYHLGTFVSKKQAIIARQQAAVALYGEFAP